MSGDTAIEIRVNEPGKSFLERNTKWLHLDRQPAGLNFYEIRFPEESRGHAFINFNAGRLPVERVISITGTEDMSFPDEGLSEFNINTEIVDTDLVSHDTARAKICSILQNIAASGWKPTIPLGMARLRGKTLTNYLLRTNQRMTLDPSYIPTLDEWMRLPNRTRWEFYANHSYLAVGFTREHTMTDPTKPGAYLLSFDLKSEAEHFRRHAGGADRKRWKQLVPMELEQLAKARAEMEAELRKEGIAIDDHYVDPPVPDHLKK